RQRGQGASPTRTARGAGVAATPLAGASGFLAPGMLAWRQGGTARLIVHHRPPLSAIATSLPPARLVGRPGRPRRPYGARTANGSCAIASRAQTPTSPPCSTAWIACPV